MQKQMNLTPMESSQGVASRAALGQVACFPLTADDKPSAGAVAAYARDGVACLRGAIGADWLHVIERGLEAAVSGASTDLDVVKRETDQGNFSVSSQAWRQVPAFRRFIFDSPVADLAWPFLESRRLVLFYDFLLVKQARSDNAATPWHQDHAYYPLAGTKVVNCWIALDPIPLETSLRFLKGSHRPAKIYRAVNFEAPDEDYRHANFTRPTPPDIDSDPTAEILATAMAPGDMLVWNSHTFHSAPGNHLNRRRAAFSVNWVGDGVTYTAAPSLETYRDPSLSPGQEIAGDRFPVVRERN